MFPPATIVVLGATGAFGAHVSRLTAAIPGVRLTVMARDASRLAGLVSALGRDVPGCDARGCAIDLDAAGWRATLARIAPSIVIHVAGPFQGRDYGVAEACVAMGAHYVDLADAREFVAGIGALNMAAVRAGVVVASGASSVPALSGAVVDALAAGLSRVDAIDIAIAPGNRAPRGRATIAAIVGRAGQAISVWEEGRWRRRVAWHDLRRRAFGDGIGRRWLSLCDVPDLTLFPARYGVRERVAFHAGLELSTLHLGLWALAWPVRWGVARTLAPLAGGLTALARMTAFAGTDRGCMTVDVAGRDADGAAVEVRWRLVAENGDGPWTPALAPVALARKLAAGVSIAPGARACLGLVTLAEILAEADGLRIRTERRERRPLYRRISGAAWAGLPAPVRRLHDVASRSVFNGTADIDGAAGPLARLAARVFGFPGEGREVPVTVELLARDGVETWRRTFGARSFKSTQCDVPGGAAGAVVERFGPTAFAMRVECSGEGIDLALIGFRAAGFPMPRFLWPRIVANERVDDRGRFRFDVSITMPILGRLVRYRGWLAAVEEAEAAPVTSPPASR
ncbi:MAG: DUF4166 domain-containing protein [Rhodospirillales bacterium]|nr:MAG: DUF4166 domain-containing protein [Rhodospirillales bacterium]